MAMRSVKVSMERRDNGGLNDNYPSALPGHELTGLEGVPRPPAGETVIHYGRLTQISPFPEHPAEPAPIEAAEQLPMDALPEKLQVAASGGGKRLVFSSLGSCLFHALVVALLLLTFIATPEEAKEEAGDSVSVVMIGNSDADQIAAGDENQQPEQQQVTAEAVQAQTVQPVEVTPEQARPQAPQPDVVQPHAVEAQPVQTAEAVQPIEQAPPETIVPEQPQILATQAPADTTVIQPVETQIAEIQPTQPQREVATPVAKPKPIEKPKDIKKPVAKIVKAKSGSKGEGREDARRGSVDGTEVDRSDNNNSVVNARRTGSGDAVMANYKGKVEARVRRFVGRVPSKYKTGLTVAMSLTIGAGGELRSLSLVRSSGNPELDQAVMDLIRQAAPFPPLPPEWGRSAWPATQAVQIGSR
ncbi:TonB family protein [Rhizobium freirei PRF 81]|uniref:TonB family protein n=1 Tax=Rhizobium freirei PRF 81 TaxID=363754 RepID=N6UBD1_9HYPH|nr:TonB family protein [Rhizobium freirei]ENN89839.1 TonB family protein [Rhizobium freirei PRF 81]